jgi:hypothetical protein
MARVHLIENNRDTELARRFEEGLKRSHQVSSDINFLKAGHEWRRSLHEALLTADGLIALFTKNSVPEGTTTISSQWMAADIGAARALGKFVIPVIIGSDVQIPALVNDIFVARKFTEDNTAIEELIREVDDAIREQMERQKKVSALSLPTGYEHLGSNVLRFHEDGAYDKSVFVMMKFPDRRSMKPRQCDLLENIWEVLDNTLASHALIARRADKRLYHDQLWENVCVHMLGSRYGVAILEDRVADELNPNVTLEYGFMKSLNREVALFRDVQFRHDRADLTGKLSRQFAIDSGGALKSASLVKAVRDWLADLGISPTPSTRKGGTPGRRGTRRPHRLVRRVRRGVASPKAAGSGRRNRRVR